jgi:hypothetical protein
MAWNPNGIGHVSPLESTGLSSPPEQRKQGDNHDDGKDDPDPEPGFEDAGHGSAAGEGYCQQEHEQDPR